MPLPNGYKIYKEKETPTIVPIVPNGQDLGVGKFWKKK